MKALTVTAPEHLLMLREYLEQLLSEATELAIAEERVEKTAKGIRASELWTRGDTPILGAVIGAVEAAIVLDDNQPALEVCQAAQDAIDVLDLAITRYDHV